MNVSERVSARNERAVAVLVGKCSYVNRLVTLLRFGD
jgi:hypothetical protein